jgi:hypothetical protein
MRQPENYSVVFLFFGIISLYACSKDFYVDAAAGNDTNAGTKEQPLKSLNRAALILRENTFIEGVKIKINPGIYITDSVIYWQSQTSFTQTNRLIIEAAILPDDPNWLPAKMPAILSSAPPQKGDSYTFEVECNHVTIQGLRFLGNPSLNGHHCCISRMKDSLEDLVISQCVFTGASDAADIYCAVLAAGDLFIVEHCVFLNCSASVVFWDGFQKRPGKRCAMRYCIVSNARFSAVCTCQTDKDFEFHHNIAVGCEYFWMRKKGEPITYSLKDTFLAENRYDSGYGVEAGPLGPTGPEIRFDQINVTKQGHITLNNYPKNRHYLQVVSPAEVCLIGAGLSTKK